MKTDKPKPSPNPYSLIPAPCPNPSSLFPIPCNLSVSDVKQFAYCPRIIHFTRTLSLKRPTTYKMDEGKIEHETTEEKEARRSLRAYGLKEGERHFAVRLTSERLGLSGLLDMVIVTPGEVIPVEFKNSLGPAALNHKYQLTAYALLVEDKWNRGVRRAFVYFIPLKRSQEVPITPNMREFVKDALQRIRKMIDSEAIPDATRHKRRCTDCEFKNYCIDRE
ncbi:MAG: CRISPR-associated protein Cas4 [Dehalococcoidales bacterium]|nr:CRISPR-associated protein Cas4 [Dehalococcoidales bacterium]